MSFSTDTYGSYVPPYLSTGGSKMVHSASSYCYLSRWFTYNSMSLTHSGEVANAVFRNRYWTSRFWVLIITDVYVTSGCLHIHYSPYSHRNTIFVSLLYGALCNDSNYRTSKERQRTPWPLRGSGNGGFGLGVLLGLFGCGFGFLLVGWAGDCPMLPIYEETLRPERS